jgi:hypothetical protein
LDPIVIEAVVAPAFLLLGLSHLFRAQLWIDFFVLVKRTGVSAAIIPMYTLPIGLLLIAGHNVWVWGWPVFLTLAGWMMTIKSGAYLLVPSLADRMLDKKAVRSPRSFQAAGALMAAIGGVLTWRSWW